MRGFRWMAICGLVVALAAPATALGLNEVRFDRYKFLDTFEAHQLQQCDKAFSKGNYREAAVDYNSFILEFPRSEAIPYALLRKGRCLQQDNKKYKAITEYEEILDYFPNVIRYAAAAKFYIGQCHWENGDYKPAIKTWAEMVEDKDYRKHDLAGTAYKHLADNQAKLKEWDEAVKYWKQVVLHFRGKVNRRDYHEAVHAIRNHYIRRTHDERKLREWYLNSGGTDGHGEIQETDIEKNFDYWNHVRSWAWHYGRFKEHQRAEEKQHFDYWSGVLRPHFPRHDDYQINVAQMRLKATRDHDEYLGRIDEIFEAGENKNNHNQRIIEFLSYLEGYSRKAREYIEKVDWKAMDGKKSMDLLVTLADIQELELAKAVYPKIKVEKLAWNDRMELLKTTWSRLGAQEMAKNVWRRLALRKEPAKHKIQVGDYFIRKSDELALASYGMLKDEKLAAYKRLEMYHTLCCVGGHLARLTTERYEKGLENGEVAVQLEGKSHEAWRMIGELHEAAKEWQKAIESYRRIAITGDKHNLEAFFDIARCYKNWGKLQQAIQQLRELEVVAFGSGNPGTAAQAVWVQSTYYRDFNRDELENKHLWYIMHKYTDTKAASSAHRRLEEKGLPIKGGMDKEALEEWREEHYNK